MDRPTHLGKYEITGLLGKGAMGVVYKGYDAHILRSVALKTVRKDLVTDDEENIFARFEHEAQAAGGLSHPGIVAVYEYGEEGNIVYLSMEYVEGHDLGEYFTRGTLFSLEDTICIVVQLLDALGHAHEQGVVHRDIKPANIILTKGGRLKVTDFGIAHIYSSELTQIGTVMGTPSYMAPEQYLGVPVDGRADLFSVGVLLYQLLTGQKPFHGSYEQIAYSVCHVSAQRPSAVAPERVSPKFDPVVETALAKKPEDRFATAQAFKEALLATYSAPVAATVSTEARIIDAEPVHASNERGAAKPATDSFASSDRSLPPPGWDPSVLKKVEQQLARFVGPFARIMVKKAAAAGTDLDVLYTQLAGELENADERKAFLSARPQVGNGGTAAVKGSPSAVFGTPVAASEAVPGTGGQITQDTIDKAVLELTLFLGPIAKVLARRAAVQCSSRQQFYLVLAENLEDDRDRQRFLQSVGIAH
jgi:serine/threonine-protein kinase